MHSFNLFLIYFNYDCFIAHYLLQSLHCKSHIGTAINWNSTCFKFIWNLGAHLYIFSLPMFAKWRAIIASVRFAWEAIFRLLWRRLVATVFRNFITCNFLWASWLNFYQRICSQFQRNTPQTLHIFSPLQIHKPATQTFSHFSIQNSYPIRIWEIHRRLNGLLPLRYDQQSVPKTPASLNKGNNFHRRRFTSISQSYLEIPTPGKNDTPYAPS